MSLRKMLGKIFILGVLWMGAFAGNRMPPEEIEKLMNVMNRVKIVKIIKTESD